MQLGGSAARVAAGAWSRPGGQPHPAAARHRPRGGIALAAATALLPAPDALAVPLLTVAGVVVMAGDGVSFAAAAEMAGPARVGTALGMQNTILFGAVAAASPLFGAAVGLLSWPAAFAMASLCPLLGWLVLGPLQAAGVGGGVENRGGVGG